MREIIARGRLKIGFGLLISLAKDVNYNNESQRLEKGERTGNATVSENDLVQTFPEVFANVWRKKTIEEKQRLAERRWK